MVVLSSINKSSSEGVWCSGPPVYFDPSSVVAIEPREHGYHSFRSGQEYCVLHLNTGATIEVWATAGYAREIIEAAKEDR